MGYTVKQLAKLAGVSIRTLHYYDEIGLLSPARTRNNGYREYKDEELLRLQQILFFRELDFPLERIKRILSSPYFDLATSLAEQRKHIESKRIRLTKLISTIDKTLTSMNNQKKIKDEELYDAFKDDDVREYQLEAQERWGNTAAYKQSMTRVGKMTKAEMEKLKSDGKAHTQALADAMDKGFDHSEVQALIAKSHAGVNFFYDCSLEMFRNLGKMYVEDPRFSAYYEKFRPGLAEFVHKAIEYYVKNKQNKNPD